MSIGRYDARLRTALSYLCERPTGASQRHTPNTSFLPPGTPLLTRLIRAKEYAESVVALYPGSRESLAAGQYGRVSELLSSPGDAPETVRLMTRRGNGGGEPPQVLGHA